MTAARPRPALRVLAVLLAAWEPASFALYASSVLVRLIDRGPLAMAVLVARVIVTGLGLAAGVALWNGRPGATILGRAALALSATATLLTYFSGAFPPAAPPGVAGPLTSLVVAYDVAWFAYLWHVARRTD